MTLKQKTYLIDFDSTFTKVEALDELVNIVFNGKETKQAIEKQIIEITRQAMEGELSFDNALKQRFDLLPIHKNHLNELIEVLQLKITDSFLRNKKFIQENANFIYIISGGFKEFIIPIVISFGIKEEHVFANEFLFDDEGNVTGYNKNNFLSQAKGKVRLVESLHLSGDVIVIGDGYTDYEIKEAGLASEFYLFVENVRRLHLIDKADKVIESLDEVVDS